ncbi:hypothetical protein ACP70R_006307 [Stipagrostis hirtigluma subsp. patula]
MAAVSPHCLGTILLWLLPFHGVHVSSLSFSFNFSQTGSHNRADLNIFYLNSTHPNSHESPDPDAYLFDSSTAMAGPSIGRVLHTEPVLLWDDTNGEIASFNMSMALCLRTRQAGSSTRSSSDDARMAFGLYQLAIPQLSSNGANQRRSNPNATAGEDPVMEVQFDSYLRKKMDESRGHMISVDVNYVVSKVQVDTTFPGTGSTSNLSSGCTMMLAEIGYDGGTKRLDTGIRIGDVAHHINASVDMRRSLPREVAIGFLSTTGQPIELHNVLSWSFNSTLGRKDSSLVPPELAPQPRANDTTPAMPWKQLLVRLEPWNWSVELNLQIQFQRIWERLSVAFNSSFSVSLMYGIANWN